LSESGKHSNIGIIIGAAVGGLVLLVLLLLAGLYAFRQKKRAEKAIGQSNPFSNIALYLYLLHSNHSHGIDLTNMLKFHECRTLGYG